ncbi:MAG: hypothetical protein AAF810_05430 [Cyanobacteria bacterium P01_D01_bin.36]
MVSSLNYWYNWQDAKFVKPIPHLPVLCYRNPDGAVRLPNGQIKEEQRKARSWVIRSWGGGLVGWLGERGDILCWHSIPEVDADQTTWLSRDWGVSGWKPPKVALFYVTSMSPLPSGIQPGIRFGRFLEHDNRITAQTYHRVGRHPGIKSDVSNWYAIPSNTVAGYLALPTEKPVIGGNDAWLSTG